MPRLTGAADVDVISCLSQYRLVCSFRLKAGVSSSLSDAELVKLTDEVAFEHLSLICDGPVLLLYQHIMDGSIKWNAPLVSTEVTGAPGSYPAPTNWSELKTALLDCLMPSNSVEESVLRLATFKMYSDESIASYALRYQNECSRFEACVQRATPGRSPYAALSIVIFRNGVVPGIKLLANQEPHRKTMTDAVAQLRRLEAANLTGPNPGRAEAHASAVSFTHVPNRTAIAQQFGVDRRAASGSGGFGSGGSGSGGRSAGGGGGSSSAGHRNNGPSRQRPRCTYSKCRKPLGHTTDRCFQKQRDEGRRNNTSGGSGSNDSGSGGDGSGAIGGSKRAKKSSGNN